MIDPQTARPVASERNVFDRIPFAASPRAVAPCARELDRLAGEIARRVDALHAADGTDKPVVHHAPGRCMVQLGPVALTVTWLRSRLGLVSDGELLAVVWRGTVGGRGRYAPGDGRAAAPTAAAATALWDEVLGVEAEDEASWRWRAAGGDRPGLTSPELAERCVVRLRGAWAEGRADA